MLDNIAFELKAIAAVATLSCALIVVSVEMRAKGDPYAPTTIDFLHQAYNKATHHVEDNTTRLMRQISNLIN